MHYIPLSRTSSPCNLLFLNLGTYGLARATVGVGTVLIWDFCVAYTRGGGVGTWLYQFFQLLWALRFLALIQFGRQCQCLDWDIFVGCALSVVQWLEMGGNKGNGHKCTEVDGLHPANWGVFNKKKKWPWTVTPKLVPKSFGAQIIRSPHVECSRLATQILGESEKKVIWVHVCR